MMLADATSRPGAGLAAFAGFAAVLSAVGLPLYMHAPKFFADTYGVSLTSLGAVLFGLRALDVIQDPFLGRVSQLVAHRRAQAVWIGLAVMALGVWGLFAVPAPVAPLLWFAVTLTLVFSAFSFLTITFYAQGVHKGQNLAAQGYLKVARWREAGALTGICLAAMAPALLGAVMDRPFAGGFAVGLAAAAVLAGWAMRHEWHGPAERDEPASFGAVLRDRIARRLLLIALVNSAPVAVSATLFLFFVESRLASPGAEGPLLILFFASAAISAPVWSRLAERHGARTVLLCAMVLAIPAFGGALFLGAGDVLIFAAICVLSGFVIGADLTLLPALFSNRMARMAGDAAQAFGLWSLVSKASLALAAVMLLPLLEFQGFQPGLSNPPQALWALTLAYAGLPCLLKLVAIGLLAALPAKEL